MDIKTGFNLFVRQALLYPLTSPFLPSVADVKKDVSYANGELVGILEAGVPVLTWSSSYGSYLDWLTALIWAEYLEIDGVTVSETPQNLWRLPYLEELIAESPIANPSFTKVGGFQSDYYWSGVTYPYNEGYAYGVSMDDGYVYGNDKTYPISLARCVLI